MRRRYVWRSRRPRAPRFLASFRRRVDQEAQRHRVDRFMPNSSASATAQFEPQAEALLTRWAVPLALLRGTLNLP